MSAISVHTLDLLPKMFVINPSWLFFLELVYSFFEVTSIFSDYPYFSIPFLALSFSSESKGR